MLGQLGYFGFGVYPWNAFLAFQSKSSCYRRYDATEKHTMDIEHGQKQQRRLKKDNVRVLRFLCLGLNIRSVFTASLNLCTQC